VAAVDPLAFDLSCDAGVRSRTDDPMPPPPPWLGVLGGARGTSSTPGARVDAIAAGFDVGAGAAAAAAAASSVLGAGRLALLAAAHAATAAAAAFAARLECVVSVFVSSVPFLLAAPLVRVENTARTLAPPPVLGIADENAWEAAPSPSELAATDAGAATGCVVVAALGVANAAALAFVTDAGGPSAEVILGVGMAAAAAAAAAAGTAVAVAVTVDPLGVVRTTGVNFLA